MYTLDANVFVREVDEHDPEYPICHMLIERLEDNGIPVIVPLIVLPEIASALLLFHSTHDPLSSFL